MRDEQVIDQSRQATLWPALELAQGSTVETDILSPRTKTFLHYCSLDAFYAIMQSHRLRFTSAKSTNDPSEFVFGQDVVSDALSALVSKHGNGPAGCLEHCIERFQGSDFRAFVFCMTEATKEEAIVGELSQWRLYGSDGRGVALKFDVSRAQDSRLLSELGAPPRRVTYGAADGIKMVQSQVENFFSRLAQFSPEELAMISPKEAQEALLQAVFWLPSTIKHHAYRHEREVRLIRGDIGEEAGNPLVFFERGSIQRPAIERNIAMTVGEYPNYIKHSPIKGVIIGPSGDQPAIHDSIRHYLASLGWDIAISRSDIPYRAVS